MKAVTLLKPHTHASVEHPAGVTITVDAGTADYLEELGIGRKVSGKAAPVARKHSPKKRTSNKGGSSI
jgi:hypothetical protein